jgi:Zn-dependent protease with chaperone function
MRPNPVIKRVFLQPRIIIIGIFITFSGFSVLSNPVAIPTPTEQAVEYHNISNLAWGINQILTLVLSMAFLILGLGTRLSTKLKNRKYLTFIIFATNFFLLNWFIKLPLERIRSNNLNQIKNDANLPVLQWIFSQFLESLPMIIVSILLALFVYWLINKSPHKWWLWTTCVGSFLFLVFLVAEPLTISHQPLGQTPVEVKISKLAEQIGIPRDSIVLENCEPFDSCEIAHVSGLGPTRIILLNKGLFTAYPESWAMQTFAHESKHYVKDDNLTGWVVMTLILLVFFFLLDRVCRMIIQRFSKQLGFTSIEQPAALPLMILVLNVMVLIALPPINLFRQHVEFEADRYGLELTHNNQALAEMVSSWTTKSKTRMPNPSLFFMLFRSSHPSDAERINFANEYQGKGK